MHSIMAALLCSKRKITVKNEVMEMKIPCCADYLYWETILGKLEKLAADRGTHDEFAEQFRAASCWLQERLTRLRIDGQTVSLPFSQSSELFLELCCSGGEIPDCDWNSVLPDLLTRYQGYTMQTLLDEAAPIVFWLYENGKKRSE